MAIVPSVFRGYFGSGLARQYGRSWMCSVGGSPALLVLGPGKGARSWLNCFHAVLAGCARTDVVDVANCLHLYCLTREPEYWWG